MHRVLLVNDNSTVVLEFDKTKRKSTISSRRDNRSERTPAWGRMLDLDVQLRGGILATVVDLAAGWIPLPPSTQTSWTRTCAR